jgi:hypothetical protein
MVHIEVPCVMGTRYPSVRFTEGYTMKRHWPGCLLLILAAPVGVLAVPENGDTPAAILGYSAQSAGIHAGWEKKFRDGISPDNIRENMRRLSARPHHVGSPYDKDNAQWILSKFKEWGFDAKIETFDVLFPTPKVRVLELLKPTLVQSVAPRTGGAR